MSDPRIKDNVKLGMQVKIEAKLNLGTGKLTEGIVEEILTPGDYHRNGIFVVLESGVRGRVKEISSKQIEISESIDRDIDIYKLIKKEDQNIEHKSSLRWDMNLNKKNLVLEEVVAKEICGFMNAEGGYLLIGVKDDLTIIGLEKDYLTFDKHDSDSFSQNLVNIVSNYLGMSSNPHVIHSFHTVEGKEICLCKIKKSPSPVYIKGPRGKEFYVRINGTCHSFDVEQAQKYISEHWK